MKKDRTYRRHSTRFLQRLARVSAGALLASLIALGGLTLSGHTLAARPVPPPTATPAPLYFKAPASPAPTPHPTAAPEPTPSPTPDYDYSASVPEREAVSGDWFSDAAFLGDSRTEGLVLYAKVKAGGTFAYRGLTVQSAQTDRVISVSGKKLTAVEALKRGTFGKVYISLGVNELGWYNNDRFYDQYSKLIDLVRKAQPDAQIYLQTLIPVTAEKSADSYINNPQILAYNDIIRKLAEEKEVYLLDVWSEFAGTDGALDPAGSVDGVHLTKAYYEKWLTYLKGHTVDVVQS